MPQLKSNFISVEALLGTPDVSLMPTAQHVLSRLLNKTEDTRNDKPWELEFFWTANFFRLDQVVLFQQSSEKDKAKILAHCAEHLLIEAYHIEKLGLCFNAKMILLSKTTEERLIYSRFAAEEAAHFQRIQRYLKGVDCYKNQSFIKLLQETVENGSKASLVYLIQIVLEGWGLMHYRFIAEHCQNECLRNDFFQILKDEAGHYGSGLALFCEHELTLEDCDFVQQILIRLFEMIQAGPQFILASLEAVHGGLSKKECIQIFKELRSEESIGQRIKILCGLLHKIKNFDTQTPLRNRGLLKPFLPEQSVNLMESA